MPAVASNSHSGFVLGGYDNVYTANTQIWQFALPGTVSEPPVVIPPPATPVPAPANSSGGSFGWSSLLLLLAFGRRSRGLAA
jgi:hypothetical protein